MFRYVIDEDLELHLPDNRVADQLFALIDGNRNHLRQWLPWVDNNKTIEDTRRFIEVSRRQFAANENIIALLRYNKELAGLVAFHKIDWMRRSTSIGYWLSENMQGKGIMTRSCTAMVQYAFDELLLNRVEIRCAEENSKSRAIPEKLGFSQEGILREVEWLYDHYVNHVVYGILKNEWGKRGS